MCSQCSLCPFPFAVTVAALLGSLTWPSMCCIYVTKSAMLIFEKENKRLRSKRSHWEWVRLFACARSLACMQYWMQRKNAHGLWSFSAFRLQKRILFRKKTIRTLPTGMNAMKEPVAVLWSHTHTRTDTDTDTDIRTCTPSDRHESQFTWLNLQNDQFDMFDTRVRVSKCNANEKLVFSPLFASKSEFLMSKASSKSKKKKGAIVVSIYRTLSATILFSAILRLFFLTLALSVHFFCLFCWNRFIIFSRPQTLTHTHTWLQSFCILIAKRCPFKFRFYLVPNFWSNIA